MIIEQAILKVNTTGHILAFGVSEDTFMREYAEHFCEWIDGTVIKMSPVHDKHDMLVRYLAILLETYFAYREIGQIRQGPFVMRYQFDDDGETRRRDREPDIQVILHSNPNKLTPTFMDGAANIVIEVVSPESVQRDYGEKLYEYERAGVTEYWIIDPIQSKARFYHLNAEQAYVLQAVSEVYETERLAGLKLHIPTLWKANLPKPPEIVKTVQKMLNI